MNRKRQRFLKKCAFFFNLAIGLLQSTVYMFTVGNSLLVSFLFFFFSLFTFSYVLRSLYFVSLCIFAIVRSCLSSFFFFFFLKYFFRVLLCFCLKRYTNTKTSNSICKHQYDKYISLLHSFERIVCMYLCDLCHVKSAIHRQRRNDREGHNKTTILLAFESFMNGKSNRHTYKILTQ